MSHTSIGRKRRGEIEGVNVPEVYVTANNDFMRTIRVDGTFNFDTKSLQLPEPDIRARSINPTHVDRLTESFKRLQSVRECFDIVIRDNGLAQSFRSANFQVGLCHKAVYKREVIAGAHSFLAVKRLLADEPENKLWQKVSCRIHICTTSNTYHDHLRNFGVLENVRGEIRRPMEYVDILTAMRARWEAMAADETAGKKKVLANMWTTMTMKTYSTMAAYVQVATQSPPVWQRILECVQLVDPKRGKPVFASNYQLQQLGVLKTEEDRVAILDRFLQAYKSSTPLTIPAWHHEIKNLAARRAIEDYIEGVVNVESASLAGLETDFEDISKTLPRLDSAFVETWVPRVKAGKFVIPEDLRRKVAEEIHAVNRSENFQVLTFRYDYSLSLACT